MKVVKVACGNSFSVALLDDGTLWGCGYEGLISPVGVNGKVMTRIENKRVKDVAALFSTIFFINKRNELWGWGENHSGELGSEDGETHWILDHVVKVETPACGRACFALRDNGEVWAWGKFGIFVEKPKKIAENIISLAADDANVALIDANHDLLMSGKNFHGQIGDGTVENCENPKCILHDVHQVEFSGGTYCCCFAVTGSGQLYGWGKDKHLFTERNKPDIVNGRLLQPHVILENATMVSAGTDHILVITKEGELLSWGSNEHGQRGEESSSFQYEPKPVFSDARYAKAGNSWSFVVNASGQLWACGNNQNGQIGIGSQMDSSSFVAVQFFQ